MEQRFQKCGLLGVGCEPANLKKKAYNDGFEYIVIMPCEFGNIGVCKIFFAYFERYRLIKIPKKQDHTFKKCTAQYVAMASVK